jgi:hypothetical protein
VDFLAFLQDRIDALDNIRALAEELGLAIKGLPESLRVDVANALRRLADEIADPDNDDDELDSPPASNVPVTMRRRAVRESWSGRVPKTDEERVAAVTTALQAGSPATCHDILKRLPGWNTADLSPVLTRHPECFRPVFASNGGKAWEIGVVGEDRVATVDPPAEFEARLLAIASVLVDGPLLPHAINARLRWPPNYVGSALSRQQHLPDPWFENTQPGWALTDYGRENLARPAELAAGRAAEKEQCRCAKNSAKMAADFSLLAVNLANRPSPPSPT